ncbi:MAG: hypothetical protein IJU50_04895 [Lachnospiraceae bacterium]|nr:hypothetical protein [Lachnospiraceae bacterium]
MEMGLELVAEGFRKKGLEVSEGEAEKVRERCVRKMERCGIEDKEGYLPLLYEDELRNYLFGRTVNTITYIRMLLKEESGSGNICKECLDEMPASGLLSYENELLDTAESEVW